MHVLCILIVSICIRERAQTVIFSVIRVIGMNDKFRREVSACIVHDIDCIYLHPGESSNSV